MGTSMYVTKTLKSLAGASAALAFLAFPMTALADDTEFSIAAGVDYSTGSYGETEDTSILFVPVTAKLMTGPWTLKAMVPWVQIDGPGSLIADGEVIGTGLPAEESGMGDVVVSASYLFYPSTKGNPFFELTGKVKLGTADEEKGLGSGETDYTAQIDVYQPVGDGGTLFLTAGYRWRGSPDAFELNDGMIGSVGASFKLSDATSAGLVFDYREAATDTGDDPMQITPFISWKSANDWGVQLYGSVGLSDGSPDTGVGIQLKRTFK